MYIGGGGLKQDFKAAVTWCQTDQSHVKAQSNLGFMYENGQGVKQVHKAVVKWYRKAADRGICGAQFNTGLLLGTPGDKR